MEQIGFIYPKAYFDRYSGVKGVTVDFSKLLVWSVCVWERKIQVIRKFPLQKTHISSVMIMRNVQFA